MNSDLLLKYGSVILASSLKFLGGPLTGLAVGIKWYEAAICAVIGMMITVSVGMYGGEGFFALFRRFRSTKSKKFSKSSRWAVRVKQKFGLVGIAFFTPILFSPIGGTLMALSFRYPKSQVLLYMLISGICWGIVQCLFFYFFRDLVVK